MSQLNHGIIKKGSTFTIFIALIFTFVSYSLFVSADDKNQAADIEKIRAEITKLIPRAADAEIIASPIDGVYRLKVQGSFAYVYSDGDFVLIGDLYNTKDQVNLGEQAASARMADLVNGTAENQMIKYGPENPKRFVTVFTDIDCGYCRKLHREIPELNKAGIQVRYLAFPRAGVGSESHKKYVSVWCNADSQQALTDAKAGKAVPSATCDHPITDNYKLGQEVGVRGTPTIIFDDGTIAPGYVPHQQLIKRLGLDG